LRIGFFAIGNEELMDAFIVEFSGVTKIEIDLMTGRGTAIGIAEMKNGRKRRRRRRRRRRERSIEVVH